MNRYNTVFNAVQHVIHGALCTVQFKTLHTFGNIVSHNFTWPTVPYCTRGVHDAFQDIDFIGLSLPSIMGGYVGQFCVRRWCDSYCIYHVSWGLVQSDSKGQLESVCKFEF